MRKTKEIMVGKKMAPGRGGKPAKLAEALLLRAELKKKIASIRERLVLNARVQEGDKPHEEPEELLREAASVLKEQESLVIRIDQANARTKLADGRSLIEALCQRDSLAIQHSLIAAMLERTKQEADRYSPMEIKIRTTFNVKAYQKRLEDLARKIREVNGQIQATNWKTDL